MQQAKLLAVKNSHERNYSNFLPIALLQLLLWKLVQELTIARKVSNMGHKPKLISPQFVRPFVKSNKNDFVDAEAICEAASRPSMRFVAPRTESQQEILALHRVRESLVRDKVKTTNQMHAFLLEFGISMPKGLAVIRRLSVVLEENELPPIWLNC
jgi:transposase